MKQGLVIFNPLARRGDNARRQRMLKDLISHEASAAPSPLHLTWRSTDYPGHATLLAQQAQGAYDLVISVGGDGTINEVINGLMQVPPEARPVFGALPAGTGNDFPQNVGLSKDLAEATRQLLNGRVRPLDVGEVRGGDHRRYFGNTLGFGFSGAAVAVAHHSRTFLRGFAMYLYIVLKTILFHPHDLDITLQVDDAPAQQASISMVNICNGPTEGGGFPVIPHARMDDGRFSYMITRRLNRWQMLGAIPLIMREKHLTRPDVFEFGEARTIHVRAEQPLIVHIDGEMFLPEGIVHELAVTIVPGALRVLSAA